jgi:hypothetical protein
VGKRTEDGIVMLIGREHTQRSTAAAGSCRSAWIRAIMVPATEE